MGMGHLLCKAEVMSDLKIELKGVELDVWFDYTPEEKEIRYDSNMEGHPGCPESIEVTGVEYEGEDWYDMLTPKAFEYIEESIWAYREDY